MQLEFRDPDWGGWYPALGNRQTSDSLVGELRDHSLKDSHSLEQEALLMQLSPCTGYPDPVTSCPRGKKITMQVVPPQVPDKDLSDGDRCSLSFS